MDLGEALERIDTIHAHLARGEQYRGYRPVALALSGGVGILAALAQPFVVRDAGPIAFIWYWVVVAVAGALLASSATVAGYVFREDELGRRRTRIIARQFLPCLFAGLVVTIALARGQQESAIVLLPGLWALFFGLGFLLVEGIFSSFGTSGRISPQLAATAAPAAFALLGLVQLRLCERA